jgi:hypothetical protein
MRVRWPAIALWVIYLLVGLFDCIGFGKHPKTSIAAVMALLVVGLFVTIKDWPFISFPKPLAERIEGATYTQPILAWRMWNIKPCNRIESIYFRVKSTWLPRTQCSAVCFACTFSKLPMPQGSCTCGIYAKKQVDSTFWRIYSASHRITSDPVGVFPDRGILGLVYLWGNIVEGEDGYRAEYAYPAKFFVVNGKYEDEIIAIANNYGVPYQKFSRWQNRKFNNGGTRWISAHLGELLQLNHLPFLSPQNRSENRVA